MIFDRSDFYLKKGERTVLGVIRSVLWFILVTMVLAALYYVVLALFINTDTERRLHRENRMYSKIYPQMEERRQLLEDVVASLQIRDNGIYEMVFHTEAPDMDPVNSLGLLAVSDSLQDSHIVEYISAKADKLSVISDRVEDSFSRVFAAYASEEKTLPPLSLPLENVSYAQVGASIGSRVNPFYKVPMNHNGIDIIAPQGDPVCASADGVVTDVILSRKGSGHVVEITHAGGYVTRYCHLGDVSVRKGMAVKKGRHIGDVGMTGSAFAPHLHYEILRDSVFVDPINYFFASVTPDEYANMMFMSVHTQQSMD